VFVPSVLDRAHNNFSPTGFNHTLIPKADFTREARTSRYGAMTNFKNHPCIEAGDQMQTTVARMGFKSPLLSPRPVHRNRENMIFENAAALTFNKIKGQSGFGADTHHKQTALNAISSGYGVNERNWDGSGWGTE